MQANQIPRYDIDQIAVDVQRFLDQHPDGMIAIRGQTATGKTALSLQLSEHFPIEVISADSRQIYRYMDIGTDKISPEIRTQLPHHLIDIVDPDQIYTAWQRQTDAHECVRQIQTRGKIPVIVWGTGLYIDMIYHNFWLPDVPPDYEYRATLESEELLSPWYCHTLLTQLDPAEAARHHPSSTRFIIRALEMIHITGKTKAEITSSNPPIRPLLMIGLRRDTDSGDELINRRIINMMEWGLPEEVRHLMDLWYGPHLSIKKPNAYPIVMWYLAGEYDRDECITRMQLCDRRLAKKQRTWFRRYMRDSQTNPVQGVAYYNYCVSSQ
jgi:tRNA dimethylallyltransferase